MSNYKADSAQARKVGSVMILTLFVLVAVVVGRVWMSGGAYEQALGEGEEHLAAALKTDDVERFDRAEERLRVAATIAFWDQYPVFVLKVTQDAREGANSGFVVALRADGDAALRSALEEPDAVRRQYKQRLAERLAALSAEGPMQ